MTTSRDSAQDVKTSKSDGQTPGADSSSEARAPGMGQQPKGHSYDEQLQMLRPGGGDVVIDDASWVIAQ